MTITVDGCGYERAALSPGQRHAPPIAALWYQAWRLSAKGWSTTKAEGAIKKQWAAETDPPPTAFSLLSFVSLPSPQRLKALQITGYRSCSSTSAPYKPCFSRQ
jgi:hypothetical protein